MKYNFTRSIWSLTFIENGCVFAENEDSDQWNSTYDGGLWIAFLERTGKRLICDGKVKRTTHVYIKISNGVLIIC